MAVQLPPFQKLVDIPAVAQRHRCAIRGLAITSIVLVFLILFLAMPTTIAVLTSSSGFNGFLVVFGIPLLTLVLLLVLVSSIISLRNTDKWVPTDVCCNLMRSQPACCTKSCGGNKRCCARLSSVHITASVFSSLLLVLFGVAVIVGCSPSTPYEYTHENVEGPSYSVDSYYREQRDGYCAPRDDSIVGPPPPPYYAATYHSTDVAWTPMFPECYGGDIYSMTGVSSEKECMEGCAAYQGTGAPCLFVTWGHGRCIYKNGKTTPYGCEGCDSDGYCAQKAATCDPDNAYCSANIVMATTTEPTSNERYTTTEEPPRNDILLVAPGGRKLQDTKSVCFSAKTEWDCKEVARQCKWQQYDVAIEPHYTVDTYAATSYTNCPVVAMFGVPSLILLLCLVAITARSAWLVRAIEQEQAEIALLSPNKMVTQLVAGNMMMMQRTFVGNACVVDEEEPKKTEMSTEQNV